MPSKNEKQHRLMEAVKHNPKFAKKVGIPQSVGRDFVAADKRAGKFAKGGYLGRLNQLAAKPKVPGASPMLQDSDRFIKGTGDRIGALRMRRLGRAKGE